MFLISLKKKKKEYFNVRSFYVNKKAVDSVQRFQSNDISFCFKRKAPPPKKKQIEIYPLSLSNGQPSSIVSVSYASLCLIERYYVTQAFQMACARQR